MRQHRTPENELYISGGPGGKWAQESNFQQSTQMKDRLKTSDIHKDPTLPSKKGRGTGRKGMHGSITDMRLSSRKTRPSRVPQMRQNLGCTTKQGKDRELNKFTATIASPGI